MYRTVLTMCAAGVLVAAGSAVATAAQTGKSAHQTSGHYKRVARRNVAPPPGSDITSFSSSSVLHVGVNRPPKNK